MKAAELRAKSQEDLNKEMIKTILNEKTSGDA